MNRFPPCFGRYERGDKECDGSTPVEACLVRDRCLALGMHLVANDLKPRNVLLFRYADKTKEYALPAEPTLLPLIDSIVISRRIRDGRANDVGKSEVRPVLRRKEDLTTLSAWFTKELVRITGRHFADTKSSAEAGEFFLLARSNHVLICCRPDDDEFTHYPVCKLYQRPSLGKLELRLATSRRPLRALTDLQLLRVHDGTFAVKVLVDSQTCSDAAELVSRAMEEGYIS